MRFAVTERGPGIGIHLRDDDGQSSQLLQPLQECQSGECGCPSDQYDKLSAMEVDAGHDQVRVRLQPLPSERFNPDQIQACSDDTTTLAKP